MKVFWCLFLSAITGLQILGHWHYGKEDPISAVLVLGYLTAIVIGFGFTWLFEKHPPYHLIALLFMPIFCWDPLHAARSETSLFKYAMAEFLGYKISRLQGLVGGIESSIGGLIFIFLTTLTFAATVFITASAFGYGFDGIERGGFAFFRKLIASWKESLKKKS